MEGWEIRRREARFRGVPLVVLSSSRTGGRRLDVHEFAGRDLPFAEDLGRVQTIVEGPVHLSGSGSTLFTICDTSLHADLLAAAITEQTDIPAIPVRNSPGIVLDEVEP